MTGADLALLGRTLVHLQPAQVAHRARLRAQRTALQRWPQLGRRVLAGPDPEPGRAETIIRGYVGADRIKRLEFALNDTGGVTPRRADPRSGYAS